MKEIKIHPEHKKTLTPLPTDELTNKQKKDIADLYEDGVPCRELFLDYNIPLEWADLLYKEKDNEKK